MFVILRIAGHELHPEHLQPRGGDAEAEAAEAREEAAAVPVQGRRPGHRGHAQDLRRVAEEGRALQDAAAVCARHGCPRGGGDAGQVRHRQARGPGLLPGAV